MGDSFTIKITWVIPLLLKILNIEISYNHRLNANLKVNI